MKDDAMSQDREYYDELEVRSASARQAAEAHELVRQIAHAKANARYYREILQTSIQRRLPRERPWRGCPSHASPTSGISRRSNPRLVA
jgi:hypothetical protein